MQPCRTCGQYTANDTCEHCGAVTRCPSCGERLDGPFCGGCGTKAPEAPSADGLFTDGTPPWFEEEDVTARGMGGTAPRSVPPPGAQGPTIPMGTVGPGPAAATTQVQSTTGPSATAPGPGPSDRSGFGNVPQSSANGTPLDPSDEPLGSSFEWAASALRSNIAGLSLVSLGVTGLMLVAFVTSMLILAVATRTRVASFTFVGWMTAIVVIIVCGLWGQLASSRAWSTVVGGGSIQFLDAFNPKELARVGLSSALVLPAVTLLAGIGYPFYLTTLEFVTSYDMTATQATARMLSETFSTMRRFLHTIVIGIIGSSIASAVSVGTIYALWGLIGASGTSAWLNILGGSDNQITRAESSFTMTFGIPVIFLIGLGLLFMIYHLTGLWTVARIRILTTRQSAK